MRLTKAAIIGVSACLLAGCAEQKTESEILMERANSYWEAARLFDLLTMYHMEVQSLDGRLIAADLTKLMDAPIRLVKYQLKNPRIDGDSATIDLDTTLVFADGGGQGWNAATKQDKWSKINDVWYHGSPKPKDAPKPATPSAHDPTGDNAEPAAKPDVGVPSGS